MNQDQVWAMVGQLYAENQVLRGMVARFQAEQRAKVVTPAAEVPTDVNPSEADNATPEA